MGYYIGVDGGGTKTAYALFDEKKRMLKMITGPGTNHENFEGSYPEAADRIWAGLNELAKQTGVKLENINFTLMGIAGVDHPFQHEILCDLLKDKGLKNFEIFNDGYIVVMAGSETGAAIGYNCGTGTCCNAIDSEGKLLQLAGLCEFTGDVGGGDWVAQHTFRIAYNDLYLGLGKSVISDKIFKKYSLESREDFLDLVSKLENEESDYIRDFIDFFFEAIEEGDKPALAMCEEMSERGAQFIAALANQMKFDDEEIEVVLSGSINVKLNSPVYLGMLMEKARALSGRKLKFIKLSQPPVTGCINWIMKQYA